MLQRKKRRSVKTEGLKTVGPDRDPKKVAVLWRSKVARLSQAMR